MPKVTTVINEPAMLVYTNIGQWDFDKNQMAFRNIHSGFEVTVERVKQEIGHTDYAISPKDMVNVLEAIEEKALRGAEAEAKKKREARKKPTRSTLAIDFDGVIHAYSKGWYDGTAYDKPMPGAEAGLRKLMESFNVYILTSRDPNQVKTWMKANMTIPTVLVAEQELFWDVPGIIGITNKKLPAIAYVDDRAVQFKDWKGLTV